MSSNDKLAATFHPHTTPQDPRLEAAARAMFSHEQCDRRQKLDLEANWNERLDDRDRSEYRDLAAAAVAAIDKMTTLHPATLLGRILAFAQTFEAVPHHEEYTVMSTEQCYDQGYATGHNDALTALNNMLNGTTR